MITVEQLIEKKGSQVWSISTEASVFDSIRLMDEKGVGALAVVIEDSLVGIISERDYARKVIIKDRSSKETKVKDIMTREVYHAVPNQNIDECLVSMHNHKIRHLPVLAGNKLVGMLSVGDLVKEIIQDQQYTIKQLENSMTWEESF